MMRYGFLFDCTVCVGCGSCMFACREENQLPPLSYFRRLLTLEPEAKAGYIGFFSAGCNHCLNPACVRACPTGAMYRDQENGVVLHDSTRCIGCSACVWACPYGAVSIDPASGQAHKCTSCIDRRARGLSPACVAACPTNALQFGPLAHLASCGGQPPEKLPDGGATQPSLLIQRTHE